MREEAIKLEKVRKSCNITEKVAMVLEIILLVATILCIIGGALCFGFRGQIDQGIAEVVAAGEHAEVDSSFQALNNLEIGGFLKFTIHMDELLANKEYGTIMVTICGFAAVVCGMVALIFDLIRRIFKAIRISETPFDRAVIAKVKVMFIIICVELLLMSGLGNAVLAGLIFWSITNILEYGFTIQQQIDETL